MEQDSNGEVTCMYHRGGDLYTLSAVIPFAGGYTYAVSAYGTLSAVYAAGSRHPGSGSGPRAKLVTRRGGCVARPAFRFMAGSVTAQAVEQVRHTRRGDMR